MSKETATALIQTMVTPTDVVAPTPAPEATEQPKTPETLESSRITHLMKKEAALVKEREAFKKEMEAHTAEKEKMRDIQKKLNDFEEMKVKDPVAALKLAGFSETDLFNFIAQAEDKSTPEEKAQKIAQSEIQKFRDEQTKKELEAQNKANEQAITQFKEDILKAVTQDKDKFEYCNFYGDVAQELIYDTVTQVLTETNELISVEEAAQMVENYYEEMDKSMSTLKKRQPKEEPKAERPEAIKEEPLKPQVSPKPPPKTLSSKTTATVASSTVIKKETPSEKRARLVAKLGSLNKN